MRPASCLLSAVLSCVALSVEAEPADVAKPAATDTLAPDWAGVPGTTGSATPALPLRARLDKDAIRAAIADLPLERDPYPRRHEADTLSATPAENFSRDFAEARKPDCLHSEGLRNQPTFFLGGLLALPFIAVAKVRGVCR